MLNSLPLISLEIIRSDVEKNNCIGDVNLLLLESDKCLEINILNWFGHSSFGFIYILLSLAVSEISVSGSILSEFIAE